MGAFTEEEIMDQVYSVYEGDVDDWSTDSDEYLAARRFAKAAIMIWEYYDNTKWRELFKKYSNASGVTTAITAGTYAYDAPSDFVSPCSYVRTIRNGVSTYYEVIPVEKVPVADDNTDNWCYFTGNIKNGYVLNFNPELTLSTGDSIEYEYYKQATYLTAASSTTEMSNPFFIIHYILFRMYKNDGEDGRAREEFAIAQQILEQMRVENLSGLFNMPYDIEDQPGKDYGFGV